MFGHFSLALTCQVEAFLYSEFLSNRERKFLKTFRKQPRHVFFKIDLLKNFAILIGKRLCWSVFLIKLQA